MKVKELIGYLQTLESGCEVYVLGEHENPFDENACSIKSVFEIKSATDTVFDGVYIEMG